MLYFEICQNNNQNHQGYQRFILRQQVIFRNIIFIFLNIKYAKVFDDWYNYETGVDITSD